MRKPVRQLLPPPNHASQANHAEHANRRDQSDQSDQPEVEQHPFAEYIGAARPAPADRPWVMANMVAGIDGAAAISGRVGKLAEEADRELFVVLRSLADVVLVGAGTIRAERYGPIRLDDDLQAARLRRGQPAVPRIAIVSRSLELDWDIPLFHSDPRPLILTTGTAPTSARDAAVAVADVHVAGDQAVDLNRALAELRAAGCLVVLTEGGPLLLGELMALRVLDELCLTISPVMGGDNLGIVRWPDSRALTRFRLASLLEHESNLLARYLREDYE